MTDTWQVPDTPILVIAGPTASGKTEGAIRIARTCHAEIVGADSMQVYRGMNIGTDTPSAEELDGVQHYLINMVNPDESYDAARFCREADEVIADIHRRGKRALVVGGTGLYLRLLLFGLQEGPPPDPELRRELENRGRDVGWPALHGDLARVDTVSAVRLHPNDGVRIVRALEVYLQSGRPMSVWQEMHRFQRERYRFRMIGIQRPMEVLESNIFRRVDRMMTNGFLEEVRNLLAAGYDGTLRPMQGLGYRRLVAHLTGEVPLVQAVEQIRTDTRQFARRQRKWFRKEPVMWVDDAGALVEAGCRWWADSGDSAS